MTCGGSCGLNLSFGRKLTRKRLTRRRLTRRSKVYKRNKSKNKQKSVKNRKLSRGKKLKKRRSVKFGIVAGPGYKGLTSYNNAYAPYFGSSQPFIVASEWWAPVTGGVAQYPQMLMKSI